MWLVVGLGNPGAKYERNRHNIGFLAVDAIARKFNASAWTKKFGGEITEVRIEELKNRGTERTINSSIPKFFDSKIYCLKPQTFMNLSGESVVAAARFYKIPPANIIVLHDELDLLPGKLRVKMAGGDGGHNGIKSIDAHMGKDYWRVRIGIGHPGDKDRVADYVLSDFTRDERDIQETMIAAITKYFPLLLAQDAAGFMNKVVLEIAPPSTNPAPLKTKE
jgi:PTH1 family peptidyl-tRNA hydrolase